ncbi:MAG: DUF4252 domain-containing protein [Bryobacteraceae bacterium]|nr:DUF4252 domain-containing protein [Bryobacteraceae bacterium]
MKRMLYSLLLCAAMAASASAQLKLNLDHLASKASESVDITLDASMLQLAGRFLSDGKSDDPKLKETVGKLKGIFVRNFEFASPGAYSQSDLQPVRDQLKSPGWIRIIAAQEKDEGAEIYVRTEQGKPAGIAILAWEPKELAIVHLDGPVSLEDLAGLGGKFGIPNVPAAAGRKVTKK